ncbi:2-aminomuconic semialdehyde dehydrogenase-like [Styela clava]
MTDHIIVSNFINGEFVEPLNKSYIDSFNPSTGHVHAKIPDSNEEDVSLAVAAGKTAFQSWSDTSIQYRSKMMLKIADILESKLEEFAEMESRDQGKPVSLARAVDIPRAILNFRFFATAILHMQTDSVVQKLPCEAVNYVLRQPIGVAGLISPWNLPMYLLTWKIAPAIAYGNTCVCKPSEFTSVTAWMLCKVFVEAGLPPGVVNIVFGYGPTAGEPILVHPDVPLISFTGSTAVGQHIQEVTAPWTKKLSLELGGKNAAVIFADVDLEKCIETTVRSSFANQGEVCLCTSRIFVQREIYEDFLSKFLERMKKIIIGHPDSPDTVMGALVSRQHWEKVTSYINLAENTTGVKVHTIVEKSQIKIPDKCQNGYFLMPTVITDVHDSSPLMQEEIFGPVTCIVPFDTEDEVIKRANDVKYGLAACLWTQDVGKTHRVAKQLEAGTVWVNCWLVRDLRIPFGGIKMSGVGREGQNDSYEFFTEAKTVCIKY